jgi:uncharacterized damage-inducible protein DinB
MSSDQEALRTMLGAALTGKSAHVDVCGSLEGLDWRMAGRKTEEGPHTVFQILNHMIYWQDFSIQWLYGEKPRTPKHASDSWPGTEKPESQEEWDTALARFKAGLDELQNQTRTSDLSARVGEKTVMEVIQLTASHNSYHIGQIVFLRRISDTWPPPGGGETW